MISLIICSRDKQRLAALEENVTQTIGVPFEMIGIDNSENAYSMCGAYNAGVARAQYPYLVFVHEDIAFHTVNWGRNLLVHLQDSHVGIIGLCGGQMLTRVPEESWKGYARGGHFIQSSSESEKGNLFFRPKGYNQPTREVVCLDGMFLAMRTELTSTIHFNEQLNGFHGYDLDICLQARTQGYRNYVVYDILLTHYSCGKIDKTYFEQLFKLYDMWQPFLTIGLADTHFPLKQIAHPYEQQLLHKLPKKLLRAGYTMHETRDITQHYYQQVNNVNMFWLKRSLLAIKVFFLKIKLSL